MAKKTEGAVLCRDAWPTKKFDGKVYTFYTSRNTKWDVDLDRKALEAHGYYCRVWKIPHKSFPMPGAANYVVFKRKK